MMKQSGKLTLERGPYLQGHQKRQVELYRSEDHKPSLHFCIDTISANVSMLAILF